MGGCDRRKFHHVRSNALFGYLRILNAFVQLLAVIEMYLLDFELHLS